MPGLVPGIRAFLCSTRRGWRGAPSRRRARPRRPCSAFSRNCSHPLFCRRALAPPPGLVAFYWHFASQANGLFVGLFAIGFVVALLDVTIPVFIGKIVTLVTSTTPEDLLAGSWPMLAGMAPVMLVLRPAAFVAASVDEPGDRRQRLQPHPLAEPLARGAAVLGLLPERFRRPHRHPRHADGAGDPREPGRAAHRRLVHPDLRHLAR